jgi:hypothetical protein
MNELTITNAMYVADIQDGSINSLSATIDGIQMSVPLDKANRHYAEILKQVEAGTLTIAEATPAE